MSVSISSPPMRTDRLTTMPPRLMTATSVVPPPMSTISDPDGSETGRPAPMAAAIGSSMSRAQRAPALIVASRTARFSTSVTPDGMPTSTRGRGMRAYRSWTLLMKYRIICSVTSKSLMTPSRSGRMATMFAGVRPTMRFASAPMASTRFDALVHGDHARLADHDPAVAHRDEGVRRAEVDPDVVAEEAEQAVEESQGPSRVSSLVIAGPGPTDAVRPSTAERGATLPRCPRRPSRTIVPRNRREEFVLLVDKRI